MNAKHELQIMKKLKHIVPSLKDCGADDYEPSSPYMVEVDCVPLCQKCGRFNPLKEIYPADFWLEVTTFRGASTRRGLTTTISGR